VFLKETHAYVHHNEINGGITTGAASHGVYTERDANRIEHNEITGGYSDEYSCGYRTGDFQEIWNTTGADDSLKFNNIDGGSGYSTYAVIASQESDLIFKENTFDGGSGTNIRLGIYIKTDDSPWIEDNVFQNCDYAIYEHNFGDYDPGNNNPKVVRDNAFLDSNIYLYKLFRESDNTDVIIDALSGQIVTDLDGTGSLASFGNTAEADTTEPEIPDTVLCFIQAESDSGSGWTLTTKNDSACAKSTVMQCSANSGYALEYSFSVPSGIDSVFVFAEYDVNEFSDSFFLGVNATTFEWKDLYVSGTGWKRAFVHGFPVSEGTNTLKIFPREKGCFLNWFVVTSDINFDIENF